MLPKWLAEALSGKVSMGRAFWLYGLGVSVVYSVFGLFIDVEHVTAMVIYLLIGLALGVVQTVILWRSSYNSPSRLRGRLVRTAMVLGFVLVAVMSYVLYTNWSLLTAG